MCVTEKGQNDHYSNQGITIQLNKPKTKPRTQGCMEANEHKVSYAVPGRYAGTKNISVGELCYNVIFRGQRQRRSGTEGSNQKFYEGFIPNSPCWAWNWKWDGCQ